MPLPLPEERSVRLDIGDLQARITPRTRMIIINSPHNPSGSVWSAQDMAMLETLVRDTKIVVVSDELYENLFVLRRETNLRGLPRWQDTN